MRDTMQDRHVKPRHRIEALIPGWHVESFEGLTRPDWLALRQKDVTASEIGCLFGDLRYLTPLALYHRKLLGEADNPNAMMIRGRVMEPAAARLVETEMPELRYVPATGLGLLTREDSYLRLRTDDALIKIGATKDYQIRVSAGALGQAFSRLGVAMPEDWRGDPERILALSLELKTVAEGAYMAHWRMGPPRQYVLQALTQAMLGGDDGAILAAMVVTPSLSLRLLLYPIPRNFDAELGLVDRARSFWEDFSAQRVPDVQAKDNKIVGDVYPAVEGRVVDLSEEPEWQELAAQRESDRKLIASLTTTVEGAEARLKQRMGSAQEAIIPGWVCTWRQNKKARPLVLRRRTDR